MNYRTRYETIKLPSNLFNDLKTFATLYGLKNLKASDPLFKRLITDLEEEVLSVRLNTKNVVGPHNYEKLKVFSTTDLEEVDVLYPAPGVENHEAVVRHNDVVKQVPWSSLLYSD